MFHMCTRRLNCAIPCSRARCAAAAGNHNTTRPPETSKRSHSCKRRCTCESADRQWQQMFFSGVRHVLLRMKHNNGLTIIRSSADALVSLETQRPGVQYRKHLSSAPTDTLCSTCHCVWVKAAEASPGCGATHNKAVGLSRNHQTRTQPSRPSVRKTNSQRYLLLCASPPSPG